MKTVIAVGFLICLVLTHAMPVLENEATKPQQATEDILEPQESRWGWGGGGWGGGGWGGRGWGGRGWGRPNYGWGGPNYGWGRGGFAAVGGFGVAGGYGYGGGWGG